MDSLRGTGVLREFNRAFKRCRMEAMLRGEGFMNYKTAEARLRKALVPCSRAAATCRRNRCSQKYSGPDPARALRTLSLGKMLA